jgi:Flp pilus assembly protein CpaB
MPWRSVSLSSLLGRRALTLRAAAGGLLVTIALLGVSQAYAHADRPPTTGFAVATATLAPGAVLGAGSLELVPLDLPRAVAARAFSTLDVLEGAVTLAPLEAGELVQLSQVLPAGTVPARGVDLSFSIAPDRALGGDLQPGERLDLVASYPAGDSRVVARGALLTGAASTGDALLDRDAGLVVTVRLQRDDELLAVVEAVDEGHVTLVRPTTDRVP